MVESIKKLGDALGQVWALFENESGELTLPALLLLAGLALATAYRCLQATRPALETQLSAVVAAGSAITAVFTGLGLYFLVQAASTLIG